MLLGERYAPILVHAHARSGSTLLLEMLGQDPKLWAAYEPLHDVRKLPPLHPETRKRRFRCRSSEDGEGDPLASSCPWRDATLLLAFLACDMLPMTSSWHQYFELDGHAGGYVPNRAAPWGSEWSPGSSSPSERTRQYLAQGQACRQRSGTIAKTVRMNGDLDTIFRVARTLEAKPPLVLHLVRGPLSVYASRRNLSNPFGIPPTAFNGSLRSWSSGTCAATHRDVATGHAQAAGSYEMVTFLELLRRPRRLVNRIYARHLNRSVPRAVHEYISSHLKLGPLAGDESQSWEFKYGTSSRNIERVHNRWREQLKPWEVHQIQLGCRSGHGVLF